MPRLHKSNNKKESLARQTQQRSKSGKALGVSQKKQINAKGSYMKSMFRPKNLRDQFAQTPTALYDELDAENHFDFDPCPVNPQFDGLSVPWGKSNYVNPPYDSIEKWIRKALEEKKQGKKSVFLIPVRTSTKYFHNLILPNALKIEFLEGRIRFKGYDSSAPFCSMLVYF